MKDTVIEKKKKNGSAYWLLLNNTWRSDLHLGSVVD